jgi:hypothetical protein
MAEEIIPLDIQQFISRHLRSVEQLEILVLLWGKPSATWSVQSVYEVILSTRPSVERWLEEFTDMGFLKKTTDTPPLYQFSAAGEAAATVGALAQLYKIKPVRIIEAIYRKNRDAAQVFADAFKLRKRP